MKSFLITFGCSWTFGTGVGYQPGMSESEYRNIAWDIDLADKLSYRGLLAEEFDLENISFAAGGSSNQKQFRLAKNFFPAVDLSHYSNVIVLWAITSTARNELYSLQKDNLEDVEYKQSDSPLVQAIVKESYSHDNEVAQLATEMLFWNDYFKSKNVRNLWIDTFNHHNYPVSIPNLVGDNIANRDMLSQLAITNGMTDMDNNYHLSTWRIDSNKIRFLISRDVLNPISTHPTALGHKQIADLLKASVKNLLTY